MSSQHPITPPPELVRQWWEEADQHVDRDDPKTYFDYIATQAARWDANQELEACCTEVTWLVESSTASRVRERRRPELEGTGPAELRRRVMRCLV